MKGGELKLYGFYASPFCLEIEIALKLKGIPYTREEENIGNESESLLRYNLIHKKIPDLVHNGKPIAESPVILEYIEETWKETPLLPGDPYERARFRFWTAFLYDKYIPACRSMVATQGAEQENTIKGFLLKRFQLRSDFFHGNGPGMFEIVMGSSACWLRVLAVTTGIELVDEETNPVLRLKSYGGQRNAPPA